ncbi:MAG TPA: hypothetical protein VKB86_04115 [Pyrinomonadaceae bacterium]|nr:hypothetical protein [Pyrinomonadaceae bacterium]
MNNRILGIAGSALLIIGIFLPIISVMGLISLSYFDVIRMSPGAGITGIGILLLGIIGLVFALTNRFKLLLIPGVLALGILALDFFRMKSSLGSAGGAEGGEFADQMASSVSIGWGFFVMVIGAIILIVAGVMKSTVPIGGPGYGAPPPPPYPPR